MLVGFSSSLGGARLVVALILKYGLEKQLFALVPGNDPNPMHVHHFNYGLIVAASRASRRSSRSGGARSACSRRVRRRRRPRLRRVRALLEPEPRVRAELEPHRGGDRGRRARAASSTSARFWGALVRAPRDRVRAMSDARVLRGRVPSRRRRADARRDRVARATSERTRRARASCRELESGADVFVILSGEAEVSVEGQDDKRKCSARSRPGGAFGEMSSLTGELRSATVTAMTDVEVLVIADADFDRLRERRPEVAVALVRMLAKRLADAEQTVDALFTAPAPGDARKDRPAGSPRLDRARVARARRGARARSRVPHARGVRGHALVRARHRPPVVPLRLRAARRAAHALHDGLRARARLVGGLAAHVPPGVPALRSRSRTASAARSSSTSSASRSRSTSSTRTSTRPIRTSRSTSSASTGAPSRSARSSSGSSC